LFFLTETRSTFKHSTLKKYAIPLAFYRVVSKDISAHTLSRFDQTIEKRGLLSIDQI